MAKPYRSPHRTSHAGASGFSVSVADFVIDPDRTSHAGASGFANDPYADAFGDIAPRTRARVDSSQHGRTVLLDRIAPRTRARVDSGSLQAAPLGQDIAPRTRARVDSRTFID